MYLWLSIKGSSNLKGLTGICHSAGNLLVNRDL